MSVWHMTIGMKIEVQKWEDINLRAGLLATTKGQTEVMHFMLKSFSCACISFALMHNYINKMFICHYSVRGGRRLMKDLSILNLGGKLENIFKQQVTV